jgi:hypothetical protein
MDWVSFLGPHAVNSARAGRKYKYGFIGGEFEQQIMRKTCTKATPKQGIFAYHLAKD